MELDKIIGPDGIDAQWFEQHPSADRYFRHISYPEIEEMRLIDYIPQGCTVSGRVMVMRLGPGLRARAFDAVVFTAI